MKTVSDWWMAEYYASTMVSIISGNNIS